MRLVTSGLRHGANDVQKTMGIIAGVVWVLMTIAAAAPIAAMLYERLS